jgi:hypothetical protein
MNLVLNGPEMAALFASDPATKRDGGWQGLIVGLQEKCDLSTGGIELTAHDRERINRYAFNYGNGGWENQLVAIFGRHLGPKLNREG